MFRKMLILPVCAVGLLGPTQFASAQSVQPSQPCPDKTAQNYNRGTDAGNSGQVAQNYNRGTDVGNSGQVAQNHDHGTSAQVGGRAVDPSTGCM
jgi:hypothetical protein